MAIPVLGNQVQLGRDALGNVTVRPSPNVPGIASGAAGGNAGFLDTLLAGGKDIVQGLSQLGIDLVTAKGLRQAMASNPQPSVSGPSQAGALNQAGLVTLLKRLAPELAAGAGGALLVDALSGGGGNGGTGFPRRIVQQVGEDKFGMPVFREYTYRGRPVLYSGDLAAKRRVDRIARRVGGSRRRRPASRTVICGKCAALPCRC